MKVKTQLAQLRAKHGNISYEKISEFTGIDGKQLRELESDKASAQIPGAYEATRLFGG